VHCIRRRRRVGGFVGFFVFGGWGVVGAFALVLLLLGYLKSKQGMRIGSRESKGFFYMSSQLVSCALGARRESVQDLYGFCFILYRLLI